MPDRRAALLVVGACCLAGLGPMAPTALLAAVPTARRLVVVLLRGAMDGLGAVPAYADPAYATVRGELAMGERDGLHDLDGFFALHPALPTLQRWYAQDQLLVLHAVASPYRERSHFDGQDLLENGTPRPGGSTSGWLNRALGLLGAQGRQVGLAVGPSTPLILRGDTPVASWAPRVRRPVDDDLLHKLADLYAQDPILGPAFAEGIAGRVRAAAAGADASPGSGAAPGAGPGAGKAAGAEAFAALAGGVGRLLAAPDGMRIAALELGGWDTHVGQGTTDGRLARALTTLDGGLAALRGGLGPAWSETAVVVMTEFGRTVAANGSGGTDHGTAGVAFVAGGAVAGGRVIARWPGLAPERLLERRDLTPTMDLRAPLKTLLTRHLGLDASGVDRVVFPDSSRVTALPAMMNASDHA